MAKVQLHHVEPGLVGTPGGLDKAHGHVFNVLRTHGLRDGPARPGSQCAGPQPQPRFGVACHLCLTERCPALPQRLAARLAPGMGQLHACGGSVGMDEIHHGLERLHLVIAPQAQVSSADTAARVDRCAFGENEARAPEGELPQMNQMPGCGTPPLRGVLAHGRNHDTVLELK
ncbi:hypothetical protein D3C72_1442820 [compost metagenome]